MARSAECKCEHNFTCRQCLANAPAYFFTPSSVMVHIEPKAPQEVEEVSL